MTTDFAEYARERGVTEEQLRTARERTRNVIDAYNLREARKASCMTQVQLAKAMGVSQNRVSRMENGDLGSMSLDSIRRYVESIGGKLVLSAELPFGEVRLT